MGVSAAYYSTLCRMGDIAAGGSAYSFARLVPSISRRWYRCSGIQPLSTMQRIFLEAMVSMLLLIVLCVPMIQKPTHEMLEIYFKKLRLIISMVSLIPVFHSIQESETLPKWAIASRIFRVQFLSFLGMFSYGVYIFHWPLIVLFGDPKGANARSRDAKNAGHNYDFPKNAFLFSLALSIGYLSFICYEVPLMKISRSTKPWKTVATGLLAVLFTVLVIDVTTKDLPDMIRFENDVSLKEKPYDDRFTPILLPPIAHDGWGDIMYRDILDAKTRSPGTVWNKFKQVLMHYKKKTRGASASVIISCDSESDAKPCDHPHLWTNNTYWVWLASPEICGLKTNELNSVLTTCDNAITVRELKFTLEDHTLPTLDTSSKKYAEMTLLRLLISVNKTVDGVINQRSVFNANMRYKELLQMSNEEQSQSSCKDVRVTVLGESVASRIGILWKDYIDQDLPKANISKSSFCPKLTNLGFSAHSALAHYICLSPDESFHHENCSTPSFVSQTVLSSFQDTRPDAVVIHDQLWAFEYTHWKFGDESGEKRIGLSSTFEKILAFNLMLSDALQNRVGSIYYLTKSPHKGVLGVGLDPDYAVELNLFRKMTSILACPSRKSKSNGIQVVLVDWARLICPNIARIGTVCKRSVHGFRDILPDDVHPYGKSGEWLAKQVLNIVLADMVLLKSDQTSSWTEAMDNPVNKHLKQLAPPDNKPPLSNLIMRHTLCPHSNLLRLKSDVESFTFDSP